MSKKYEDIFLELIPEDSRKFFGGKFQAKDKYENEMTKAFQKVLNGTFVNAKDGGELSVKDLLVMKTVGFTLQNPTPKNVKLLCEMAGESVKIDITSGGKSVDDMLKRLAVKEDDENGENS